MPESVALPRLLLWTLLAGAVAGTLDIVFACAWWHWRAGTPAVRVFQSVAAGLLGRASFGGGAASAMLGLALHFAIATAMAAAYLGAAAIWPALSQRPWLAGIAYGVVLYAVMRYVVVPLSAAPPPSRDPAWVAASVLAHALLVGLPIAWCARAARLHP